MENMHKYLEMRKKKRVTFDGLYRTDTLDYPEDAIREALLNSLVHWDYAFSASTLIGVYDDRIEFVSVGGLIDGINLEDILLSLSICRNPKLAAIFYRLEWIEACNDTWYVTKIEVTNNAFKITLPNLNYLNDDEVVTDETLETKNNQVQIGF